MQADLCRLPQNLVQFDAVLAANVLERLPDPALFLDQLAKLVRANGIAVLASAFSWSEKCTAKDSWLGGFYQVLKQCKASSSSTCVIYRVLGLLLS